MVMHTNGHHTSIPNSPQTPRSMTWICQTGHRVSLATGDPPDGTEGHKVGLGTRPTLAAHSEFPRPGCPGAGAGAGAGVGATSGHQS